ncbi:MULTISPECIES: glycosyltransferase [Comamonas]|nr:MULTISPECIES: glycosyltransferase [Comamonas]MPT10523.1 glycosyltransferase [Comamonas sp.]
MNNKIVDVSIVVSTWRRHEILKMVLQALLNQSHATNITYEILVVDSYSGLETMTVIDEISSEKVRYLNILENSISSKRNFGINNSFGKYIAFLDDDCVPEAEWLRNFFSFAEEHANEKVLLCGGVYFDEDLVARSNYYRYRNGRHFKSDKGTVLSYKNIVTMNMFVRRDLLLDEGVYFDDSFKGYGYEDIDFGLQLSNKGIGLITCDSDILHLELKGSLRKFCKKFYHCSKDGMRVFYGKNKIDASLGETSLLESESANIKIRIMLGVLDSYIPKLVLKFCELTDGLSYCYVENLYKLVLAAAYRDGKRNRYKNILNTTNVNKTGWYD